ncbi:alpha/beta hydrolase [Sphaerisporangium krabiense]|uniref:Pimeloyl-ACP methyl ester carboxylesterase n=1 Tax=Sphaerisporangium krabiense TaxID=763782 RepID=A0A7W9DR71_9ACTN|nr:alpha/beta hydrolase [Sphaerisporangium krabiense]MBB5628221.1 pimeloyl-ACP methyl ester carboxylesterase [Sphaerisporangium krabiense]GII66216.1 alpha/beta hydrolase [Sphaerisporangium krabiense]
MNRVTVNGVDLAYDSFGSPGGRPLLLIMGLGAQMIQWDERLCAMFAEHGHHVVRFDNRDAGLSTHLHAAGVPDLGQALGGGPVAAPYLVEDMADDAAGLLDALGWEGAHLLGVSMGGMIAQSFAARHPARTRSLTSVMSTPSPYVGAPTERALAALLSPSLPERDAVVRRAVESARVLGSPGYPMDEERVAALAARAFDRSYDPAGFARQFAAILASGDRTPALRGLSVPALVIHGERDQLIQPAGGVATADAIPEAKLLTFPGMGHDLPEPLWPDIVSAVSELTGRAEAV